MPLTSEPTDRWAWVEIDLNAIRKNTRAIKALLRRGTKLMCAVKADGYGHGAVECTKAMKSAGADQFAVATVAEGVQLRQAGIEWPILMLNQAPEGAIQTLVDYDIMPSVYTSEFALADPQCQITGNFTVVLVFVHIIVACRIFVSDNHDGRRVLCPGVIDMPGSDAVAVHFECQAHGGLAVKGAFECITFHDTLCLDADDRKHQQDRGAKGFFHLFCLFIINDVGNYGLFVYFC